jgi:hypothetical protein
MQTLGLYILMPFECGEKQKMMDREHDEGGLKLVARLINGASPGVKLWPARP